MIEELSKIRALRSADFRRQDPLDSPKVTHPYVRLSPGPMREYEPDTDRDALRQLGIDPPNRPLLGPHGKDHRHQCEAINDQILDTIASQQPLAADRQKLTVMLQSGVPQPQERHKRYKYVCAQLRRKKTKLTNLWDEYEAVLERRTGQHFLDVQQDRSAKQIQDLFSLPRIEVEMQIVQWRSTRTDLLKERHTLHSYLSGISQAANKEPMELADVPLRQSLLAKRAGIDRQTEDLKHRIAEGDRILEGKRQHDGPCSQLENLVLSCPINFVLGDQTGVPPQTRIRTVLQTTVTGDTFRVPTLYSSRHTIDSLIDRRHLIPFGPALDLGQLRRNPEIPITTEECTIANQDQSLGRQEPSSGPNLGQNQALSSHTGDQQRLPHSDRRATHYPEAILQDHACQWSQQPRHI